MGLRDVLRPGIPAGLVAVDTPAVPAPVVALASPWSVPNHLASVSFRELFDVADQPVTRAEAMEVPSVARARHIITGTIARIPLRAYRGTRQLGAPGNDRAPSWIDSTSSALPPWHRMLWTVDDLYFFGWSCWYRSENAREDGRPLRLDRLPMGRWRFDGDGHVEIDRGPVDGFTRARTNEVVLIPGPHEGILSFGAKSVRHAADLQAAVKVAAETPAATAMLKQTAGETLLPDEIDELLARYQARRKQYGVGYLSPTMDLQEYGEFNDALLTNARNAAAVDIARLSSLPADLLDASGEKASLTYANSRDNDRRAVDYGVGLYMGAISAALSQDAIIPAGTRVAFDLEEWLGQTVPGQDPAQTPPPAVPRETSTPEATA